ncbi:MAG: homoserine dehydrogenase [Firmicutes bacterium]|nr:homoserine dehydrogenase [Bacillota bacterium]
MNIAIIGCGGVGKALLELLERQRSLLAKENLYINVKYIIGRGDNITPALTDTDLDVAVILTPTNKDNGQPGLDYARAFLSAGKHVVTADKGIIIHGYTELRNLAETKGVKLAMGCTTGGALPSINAGLFDMAGSSIVSIEGILNGTSNYILDEMEMSGCEYATALAKAQRDGIAEANPSLDVDGWDTAGKLLILTKVLIDEKVSLNDVKVEGITRLTAADIREAAEAGCRYKLVGRASFDDEGNLKLSVKPECFPVNHLLYSVCSKSKAVRYVSDTLGELVIMGGASGTTPAAASVLRDLVNLHRNRI